MPNTREFTPRDAMDFFWRNAQTPYRELVQHHFRRQSEERLIESVKATGVLAGLSVQELDSFVEHLNNALGHNPTFWKRATFLDALDAVVGIARARLNGVEVSGRGDAFDPARAVQCFNLLQVSTVFFAWVAAREGGFRAVAGIRKGLF